MNSANKGIAIFIMFFAMFLIRQFVSYAVFPENTRHSITTLRSVVKALNSKCPMKMNNLCLNKCTAKNESVIIYDYNFINLSLKEIDDEEFESTMQKAGLKACKTDPTMKFFRDNHITIEQIFRDKNNILVTKIVFKPEDYAD